MAKNLVREASSYLVSLALLSQNAHKGLELRAQGTRGCGLKVASCRAEGRASSEGVSTMPQVANRARNTRRTTRRATRGTTGATARTQA
eukprot:3079776-Rhodomonas_salina.1